MTNHWKSTPIAVLLIATAMGASAQAPGPIPHDAKVTTVTVAKPPKSIKAQSAPPEKAPSKPNTPLLPTFFSGWDAAGTPKSIADPAQADSANAAALKEYGFTDALQADYTRDGETLHVKALRFTDASGAYGAYTFYRKSGWPAEDIGSGASSYHNRVLFWIGNVVLDSDFPHISAMTGGELRELAAAIPIPAGNKTLAPPILGNMPPTQTNGNFDGKLDPQTTHYVLGPAGYLGSGGVLPAELVAFDHGAEIATATYNLRSGPATLTIINYPTPQMAAAQEKRIAAYIQAGNTAQNHFTQPLQASNPASLEVRRSGPLVAIVSGDAIQAEAHKLLASVHYEADLADIPQPVDSEIKKTAHLLLSIVTLVVVMFIASVLLALFLGGGRALYRISRGKPVSSMNDEEFTKLDLS